MSNKDFLNKKITVKQIKSSSNLTKKQLGCIIGLGLRGIGSTSDLDCTLSTLGMIKKVEHLIQVESA